MSLEEEVGTLLRQKGLTLGVVESASGGLISHRITNVAGSSEYYKGAVTAYSNEVKIKVVGVKETTINQYGAVSSEGQTHNTDHFTLLIDKGSSTITPNNWCGKLYPIPLEGGFYLQLFFKILFPEYSTEISTRNCLFER